MSDATKEKGTANGGFSSRWMLDGRDGAKATVAGDARAAANAIDTDGDGVADTLALRVDTERRSAMARFGTWVGRSLVTIVLVAALVVAAAATTSLLQTRTQLDDMTADRNAVQTELQTIRADLDFAEAKVATLENDAAGATGDAAKVETERDELLLEVKVLRSMLLDAERRAASDR